MSNQQGSSSTNNLHTNILGRDADDDYGGGATREMDGGNPSSPGHRRKQHQLQQDPPSSTWKSVPLSSPSRSIGSPASTVPPDDDDDPSITRTGGHYQEMEHTTSSGSGDNDGTPSNSSSRWWTRSIGLGSKGNNIKEINTDGVMKVESASPPSRRDLSSSSTTSYTNIQEHDDHHHECRSSSTNTAEIRPTLTKDPYDGSLSSSTKKKEPATREDRLRQDCSFFYQGLEVTEDGTTGGNSSSNRTMVPPTGLGFGASSTAAATLRRPLSLGFRTVSSTSSAADVDSNTTSASMNDYHSYYEYQQHHNHRRVLSGRAGIEFMNKYERLNQVIDMGDDEDGMDNDHADNGSDRLRNALIGGRRRRRRLGNRDRRRDDHDLFLDEDISYAHDPRDGTVDFTANSDGQTPSTLAKGSTSSLLIYEQHGRVLMRLPRDQVRLLMDYDLEAGILAVEQWRHPRTSSQSQTGAYKSDQPIDPLETHGGGQVPAGTQEKKDDDEEEQLYYVLTVSDDLYRRVVSEMSYALVPPYWGFFKCCNQDNEKADIRLALLIISIVLVLIFIGSLEWPTE